MTDFSFKSDKREWCWFLHDWSKWELHAEYTKSVHQTGAMIEKGTIQLRACKVCNMVQSRRILM